MTCSQTSPISSYGMVEGRKCLEAGAIGGLGAIPGTFAAHAFDVIKVRQQLTGERLHQAVGNVYRGGISPQQQQQLSLRSSSITNFFAGSIPGIQQKVITRTPMFLVSAASVQIFEESLGFDAMSAAFVGSAVSGYITGFLASPWEWQKVLVSQKVNSPATGGGLRALMVEAKKVHGLWGGMFSVGRRFHGAGVRNGIFDSTFFGVKYIVEDWSRHYRSNYYNHRDEFHNPILFALASAGSGFAYGIAAIVAVTVDYAVDVCVKRSYATGPERPLPFRGLMRHVAYIASKEGRGIFKGLGVKSMEFATSYMITGLLAPHVKLGIAFAAAMFSNDILEE